MYILMQFVEHRYYFYLLIITINEMQCKRKFAKYDSILSGYISLIYILHKLPKVDLNC